MEGKVKGRTMADMALHVLSERGAYRQQHSMRVQSCMGFVGQWWPLCQDLLPALLSALNFFFVFIYVFNVLVIEGQDLNHRV